MCRITLSLMALLALAASARSVRVLEQRRLLPSAAPAYYPVLSPDGGRLLFSSADATGLNLCDLASGRVTRVSDEPGAGYDAFFDGGGKVYYVTHRRSDDNLLMRTGHAYEPATATDAVVLAEQHGAMLPVRATAGAALKAEAAAYAATAAEAVTVYTRGSTVVIGRNGREAAYSPVPSHAGYLWASLSPDATRVAFFAAERGICIIDLDGRLLAELGNYEMPSWVDNHHLVAQHATDDGHQFTSSQLLLLSDDGSWQHALTAPTSMTMQPTAAAGTVVYTTIDGLLHMIKLEITQP